jgi:hypothetical protein
MLELEAKIIIVWCALNVCRRNIENDNILIRVR